MVLFCHFGAWQSHSSFSLNILKIAAMKCFRNTSVFCQKKVIQVWNNMRVKKWWIFICKNFKRCVSVYGLSFYLSVFLQYFVVSFCVQVMSDRSYLRVERTWTPPQSHCYEWETKFSLSPEFPSWGRVSEKTCRMQWTQSVLTVNLLKLIKWEIFCNVK